MKLEPPSMTIPILPRAVICLCLALSLSACTPPIFVRPEPVEIPSLVWIPVPDHRIESLAPLVPGPPADLVDCVVRFAPEAYATIELAETDRAALRGLMKTPPKETATDD